MYISSMNPLKRDAHYMRLGSKPRRSQRRRKPVNRIYVGNASYMPRPYKPTQCLFRVQELVDLIESFRCRACEELQRVIEDPRYCHHWDVPELAYYRGCTLEEILVCQECVEKRGMKSCAGCKWHQRDDFRSYSGLSFDWWMSYPNLTVAECMEVFTSEGRPVWFCSGCWPHSESLLERNAHADEEEYLDILHRQRENAYWAYDSKDWHQWT